jgi:hypothetical protein
MARTHLTTSLIGGLILLTACGDIQRMEAGTDARLGRADTALERLHARSGVRAGGAQVSDGVFVAPTPERANASARLPARLQTANAVQLVSRDPLTLSEVAARLADMTDVPHLIATGPEASVASGVDPTPRPGETGAPLSARSGGVTMRPSLRGPLSEVLDRVAAGYEVEWSYEGGRVVFRDFVTRQYQIAAMPGTQSASNRIGSDQMTVDSGHSSDVWADIRTAIEGLLGGRGSLALSPATGSVTVTARPGDQARIAEYVRKANQSHGQQIAFDVNVLTVTLSGEKSLGIDLDAVLRRGLGEVAWSGSEPSASSIGRVNIGLSRPNFDFDMAIRALSRQGKVSVETRTGATTTNNRMTPIEVVDQQAYLREISIVQGTESSNTRILRSADKVTTGFQMQILPRVLNNREIMVQYAIRLSDLKGIQTFGDGSDAIQLPEISTTAFEQQSILENNQTLIMAGFERSRTSATSTRSLAGLAAGGGRRGSEERVATVVMITPRILSRRAAN